MSAAFDLIRHDILVDTLQTHFGITDRALLWVKSYLDCRRQRVEVDGFLSREFDVLRGVPQGSCLGPLLFTLYISRLFQEIQHNFSNNPFLNDKKTEFLICGTPQQVSKLHTRNTKSCQCPYYSC